MESRLLTSGGESGTVAPAWGATPGATRMAKREPTVPGRPTPDRSGPHAEVGGPTSTIVKSGAPSPCLSGLGAADYLAGLPRCGALAAFRLCPVAQILLYALAGALEHSGDPLGKIAEEAGLRSPATQARASRMLAALGPVAFERVRGPGEAETNCLMTACSLRRTSCPGRAPNEQR
jgi:hypothetical protein